MGQHQWPGASAKAEALLGPGGMAGNPEAMAENCPWALQQDGPGTLSVQPAAPREQTPPPASS